MEKSQKYGQRRRWSMREHGFVSRGCELNLKRSHRFDIDISFEKLMHATMNFSNVEATSSLSIRVVFILF
jgi:hypothetical protein